MNFDPNRPNPTWETFGSLLVRYEPDAGDPDPGEIGRVLRLSPSKIWRIGDRILKTDRIRHFGQWELDSDLGRNATPEEHVRRVLEQLQGESADMRAYFATTRSAAITVALYIWDYPPPAVYFPPDVTGRLSELGLSLGVDIYPVEGRKQQD